MVDLFQPELLLRANAGHGAQASVLDDGSTLVSVAKPVEEGARAMLLLVPGAFRVDVRGHGDAVQLIVRPLLEDDGRFGYDFPGQEGWRAGDAVLPPADEGRRYELRAYAEPAGSPPVYAMMLVLTDSEPRLSATHLVLRAILRRVEPGRVQLR